MSKLRDRHHRHDAFHQRARKEGFAARSVYKLEEIDARFRLFRAGMRVLDLGCRPGSWLQYAARKTGDKGRLVGLDRPPLDVVIPAARIDVGDVYTIAVEQLVGDLGGFDLVMSDMAPDTSGIRSMARRAWRRFSSARSRSPSSSCSSARRSRISLRCRAGFAKVATVKPRGSRQESIEQYVV